MHGCAQREALLEVQKERFYHRRWQETSVALSDAVLKVASTGRIVYMYCYIRVDKRMYVYLSMYIRANITITC